jgi:hypothetical protein
MPFLNIFAQPSDHTCNVTWGVCQVRSNNFVEAGVNVPHKCEETVEATDTTHGQNADNPHKCTACPDLKYAK